MSKASAQTHYQMPQTDLVPIKNTAVDRQYELIIKLPENYEKDTDKRYPVIYFTDAVWHIEMLSAANAYMFEDSILVGISWQQDVSQELLERYGAHVSRYRDYSMIESTNEEHQRRINLGQADVHLTFIRDEVISYVEANYRTRPDERTYFGYSMGGEFGAYILMSKPDSFKNYILGSPSFSAREITELTSIAKTSPQKLNANVFISFGVEEDRLGKFILEFVSLLKGREDQSLLLRTAVIEGDHSGAFPGTAVQSFQWLTDVIKN